MSTAHPAMKITALKISTWFGELPCPLSESQSQVVSVVPQLVLGDQEGLANLDHPDFMDMHMGK